MSTSRPSVTTASSIIQKYIGSDYDKIVELANSVPAIKEILDKAESLDAAIDEANAIVLEGTDGFVEEPLLDYAVDFSAEGFTEDSLGAMTSALALLTKLNEQNIGFWELQILAAATSVGTSYSSTNGIYDVAWVDVMKVLDGLPSVFTRSGAIVVADNATQTTPYNYNTSPVIENLPNDTAGTLSDDTKAPINISSFFSAGQLEFASFKLGDLVKIRVDLGVKASSNDSDIEVLLSLAEGTLSAKVSTIVSRRLYDSAVTYDVVGEISFYISNADILTDPGHIQFKCSSNALVTVNSFEAYINAKS